MDDALVVALALQKGFEQRAVAERALGQFRHHDHREAAGEVPAELALDRQAVDGRPRLRPVVQQVELNRRPLAGVFHQGVDAGGERRQQRAGFLRQARPFVLGDLPQADRADQQIVLNGLRPHYLRQPAAGLAAEEVELPKPVLRHGVTKAEEQVLVVVGVDVRNAPVVAVDLHRAADSVLALALHRRHARGNFLLPPTVKLRPRYASRRACRGDLLATPQPGQQHFGGKFHRMHFGVVERVAVARRHWMLILKANGGVVDSRPTVEREETTDNRVQRGLWLTEKWGTEKLETTKETKNTK